MKRTETIPASPVILITGAGKGIGKAIAQEFCIRNSTKLTQSGQEFRPKLFLNSRTKSDLDAVHKLCGDAGVPCEIAVADLSTTAAVNAVFDACLKTFGTIDCLVNSAGVGRWGDFSSLTESDFDYVMATNLKGLFFLTQKIYAVMEKKKAGHVFFVTSVAAEKPFEQSAIYCMSKFAQKGFLEVLRLYGRKNGIRITNVMPGAVETPIWGPVNEETRARMMQPEDVAVAILDAYLQPTRTSVEEIVLRPVSGDLQD
ncbi:MAG: SDR family oxidoreductase [Deltaproteobacteria bacterium]|nr:SDR family oxidoreductase [Deltaproteobacteria bacterium]